VEPTVRIGWSKSDFRQNHTLMPRQTQLTRSLPAETNSNPLTEGFTGTLCIFAPCAERERCDGADSRFGVRTVSCSGAGVLQTVRDYRATSHAFMTPCNLRSSKGDRLCGLGADSGELTVEPQTRSSPQNLNRRHIFARKILSIRPLINCMRHGLEGRGRIPAQLRNCKSAARCY
jgi:hypothetical protein